MIIAGLMTGTSADALDVALVRCRTHTTTGGDELHLELLDHREVDLPPDLRRGVQRLLEPESVPLSLVAEIDSYLGRFSGDVVQQMLTETGHGCDLVVSHGQTVQHLLDDGRVVGTLQIGQPAWIAERTGCAVVSDVRSADVAAGGQGAPLASMLDTLLLADAESPTAALNLGGIANLTVVRPDCDPLAYDSGPANALIDVMARRITRDPHGFDRNGELAAAGAVVPELLADLLDDPYYARPAPKSTGKEHFHARYLDAVLDGHPGLDPHDVIATLTALTAQTVASECRRHGVTRVLASGGGTRNPVLMSALDVALGEGTELSTTADLGLPPEAKEAVLMALLGWLTWHGLPGTIPSCTGARDVTTAGRITPGMHGLRLPEPRSAAPRRVLMTGLRPTTEGDQ